jgi:hypothetical protein
MIESQACAVAAPGMCVWTLGCVPLARCLNCSASTFPLRGLSLHLHLYVCAFVECIYACCTRNSLIQARAPHLDTHWALITLLALQPHCTTLLVALTRPHSSLHMVVVRTAGDPLLRTWVKAEQPLIAHPPQGALTGWRDPFLVGRPDDGEHAKWTMLIGSGHSPDATTHARGAGCAMVYQSDSPTTGQLSGAAHVKYLRGCTPTLVS